MLRNPIYMIVNPDNCSDVDRVIRRSMLFSSRVRKDDKTTTTWLIRRSSSQDADVDFLTMFISELNSWGISPGMYKLITTLNK